LFFNQLRKSPLAAGGDMTDANEASSNQVLKTEHGRVIAFWRGQLVVKLDGELRYFESEAAAKDFLAARDRFGNSTPHRARPGAPRKPVDAG
jgi:hypothetical protein